MIQRIIRLGNSLILGNRGRGNFRNADRKDTEYCTFLGDIGEWTVEPSVDMLFVALLRGIKLTFALL